jgi:hypothetical protein
VLDAAQALGAQLARSLAATDRAPAGTTRASSRLNASVERLRAASAPMIAWLNADQRIATGGEDRRRPR